MLKERSVHLVFGTKILLLGCKHAKKSSDYNPRDSQLYQQLEQFNPSAIFIELDDFFEIDWVTHNTDCQSIKTFLEDTGTELEKYDLSKEHYNNYNITVEFGSENADTEYEKALNKRQKVKQKNPENFEHMYQIREEKAAIEFVQKLNQYDRVAIHCGMGHYPAHYNYLKLLSDV